MNLLNRKKNTPIITTECQNSIEIEQLTIWSKWGKKVFVSNNGIAEWDGTFNQKNAAADIYFYQILAIVDSIPPLTTTTPPK